MTSAPPVRVQNLICHYGNRRTLDGVSLTLEAGEILGVTGAAGAGTSTLIKAIMLLVAPRGGRVLVRGRSHELASSRTVIGYLPEEPRPPGHLTGRDVIAMTRAVQIDRCGVRRPVEDDGIDALAIDLELDPNLLAHPVRRYAKDDVQKLALVALLSTNREIFLLDRPMADLEPGARAGLRHRLKGHADHGGAVLIGSSRIEDFHDVAGRLLILSDGRLTEADKVEPFTDHADGGRPMSEAERMLLDPDHRSNRPSSLAG